ncbi:MAG: hypothetical protein AAF715_16900 [Myxococcota bacterium]
MRTSTPSDRPRGRPQLRLVSSAAPSSPSRAETNASDARVQVTMGNQRAARSRPEDVAEAEEVALLLRAQQLLARVLRRA